MAKFIESIASESYSISIVIGVVTGFILIGCISYWIWNLRGLILYIGGVVTLIGILLILIGIFDKTFLTP